jgi:hypothetical protein
LASVTLSPVEIQRSNSFAPHSSNMAYLPSDLPYLIFIFAFYILFRIYLVRTLLAQHTALMELYDALGLATDTEKENKEQKKSIFSLLSR